MISLHRSPRGVALLLASLVAVPALAVRTASATEVGVGTARGTAIPLRLTVGGVSVDLLDIDVSASIDTTRAAGPTARATLTAMRTTGPAPQKAGELSSLSNKGQRDDQSAADVPLSIPGVLEARLETALARTEAEDSGSSASVGATLAGLSAYGGLLTVDSATASMSVTVTPGGGAVATKTVQIPSVGMLRIGDLAGVAGVALDTLPVEDLLAMANALWLAAPGDFGALLAQEQAVQAQIDAAQAELDAKTAERASVQSSLASAESDLIAKQAELADAQAAVTAAQGSFTSAQSDLASAEAALAAAVAAVAARQSDVSAAQVAVTSAQAAVTSAGAQLAEANANLADAQADLATLQSLSLLSPGALATLQALADKYGVALTVDALNFAGSLATVTSAVQAVVTTDQAQVTLLEAQLSDAQAALAVAAGNLAAAQAALASAEAVRDEAQVSLAAAQAALTAAGAALASAQDAVVVLNAVIDALQAEIASLSSVIALLDPEIATLQATIAALGVVLAGLVDQLAAFVTDLRTLVGNAPIVSLEGVTIVMTASADASGSEPVIDISFAKLNIGDLEVATDVNTIQGMEGLTQQIQDAVNGVGSVLGLAPAAIGFLTSTSDSGTDPDGYRFAKASFTLLSVSLPMPGGSTLSLSVGDPEVFAEFVPASGGGDTSGGGDGDSGTGTGGEADAGDSGSGAGGGSGSGGDAAGGGLLGELAPSGDAALPVTGLESRALTGAAFLLLALVIGATLRRRRA